MPKHTKQTILELQRCTTDPHYFIEKYCYIEHPTKGHIPVGELYQYQNNLIKSYENAPNTICLSSRQMGISMVTDLYNLWFAMFHFEAFIGIVSPKMNMSRDSIRKMLFAYENLPDWLKTNEVVFKQRDRLVFKNGSEIVAKDAHCSQMKAAQLDIIHIDNLGLIPNQQADELMHSLYPMQPTRGFILTGCACDKANVFAQIWERANNGLNDFLPILVNWKDHPSHEKKVGMYDMKEQMGEERWNIEFDNQFY